MWLSRWLLSRVLRLTRRHFARVVVISRDPRVLKDTQMGGGLPLKEEGSDLNAALTQASHFASACGADGILVLPTDLPFLTDRDVQTLLRLATDAPAVVIAPCRRSIGTNALLMRPPLLIPFAFGPASFPRHLASARLIGVRPTVLRTPTLAFDLDTPEDWQSFCSQLSFQAECETLTLKRTECL